jgi:hypothetical protein
VAFQKGEDAPASRGGNSITQSQINILTQAGFNWEPKIRYILNKAKAKTFEERFEELKAYKVEYGDCLVPQIYPGLGGWVSVQRTHFKNWNVRGKEFTMTQERYDKLVKVGFKFDKHKGGGSFQQAEVRR